MNQFEIVPKLKSNFFIIFYRYINVFIKYFDIHNTITKNNF